MLYPDNSAASGGNCSDPLLLLDLFGGEPQLEHKLILVSWLYRYKFLLAPQHTAVTSGGWEGTVGLSKGNPNIQVGFLSHLPGSDGRCVYSWFCSVAKCLICITCLQTARLQQPPLQKSLGKTLDVYNDSHLGY